LTLAGDVVRLTGVVRLDEAEALCAALVGHPERVVDLSGLEQAHTAAIQALLALRPPIVGEPTSRFLREHVRAALLPSPRGPEHAMTAAVSGGA
jgi:hypothetical protein